MFRESHPRTCRELLTFGRAQSVPDEISCRVKEATQVEVGQVERLHAMIGDFGALVEAGPRAHNARSVSGVEHVGDVVRLEPPLVFGSLPK